jgi:solute carrier family 25 oxoglutarate transporter 11
MSDFLKNFLIGGVAGCVATSCIQPMDMLKVRIQLNSMEGLSTSPIGCAKDILAAKGVKGFYTGLDSAILRQCVYAPWRLGIYFNLSEYIKTNTNKGEALTVSQKIGTSLFAGAFGSFVATPCDLVLVRMQADQRPGIPEEARRNYTGVGNAFKRIFAEEGI